MTPKTRKVLIVGALGVVGRAAAEHFAKHAEVQVVGLARRSPDFASDAIWVTADLRDREATIAALASHRDTAHVIYAAVSEQPILTQGWRSPENASLNAQMLRNVLDALDSTSIEHLTLLQGTKAYGVHIGRPMRVPAREQDAVRDHSNFYFDQEDLIVEYSKRFGFRYSIFRPQVVLGNAIGSAMNVVAALGAYATLMRELGRPLSFPGHPHLLMECTDARLIARAIEWSWGEPKANGEAFNITNGDVIVWRTFFERLASYFKISLGEQMPAHLADEMPKHAALWKRIAERENLRVSDFDKLIGLSWQYSDATWSSSRPLPVPPLLSTIKLRQFGFHECIDSENCVVEHLEAMRTQRYLP